MKQKDFFVLIGVAIVSLILGIVVSNVVFGSSKRDTQVGVVDKITADFPVAQVSGPDKQFNTHAFNPAQLINIGQQNHNPFADTTQP